MISVVPGDGGSRFQAKLNKTTSPHYLCATHSDWYDLWLNLEQMIPKLIDCWVDNMKLNYDPETHKTYNNEGVNIRIPGFGNDTLTVEYLDSSLRSFSIYFSKIVNHLITLGYERGINIHGAPYDFRKAASMTLSRLWS